VDLGGLGTRHLEEHFGSVRSVLVRVNEWDSWVMRGGLAEQHAQIGLGPRGGRASQTGAHVRGGDEGRTFGRFQEVDEVVGTLRRRFEQAKLLASAGQLAELRRGPACALFVEYLSAIAFAVADGREPNVPSVLAGVEVPGVQDSGSLQEKIETLQYYCRKLYYSDIAVRLSTRCSGERLSKTFRDDCLDPSAR
jgi:hypothetical protein